MSRKSTPEDFWARVDTGSNCWLWTGKVNDWGYGRLMYQGRLWLAHRLAFNLANGFLPLAQVNHTCNTPACVRPEHLIAGTPAQNAEYMARCGRAHKPRGTLNVKCKLTPENVIAIRAKIANGSATRTGLSVFYKVSESTINDIVRRRTWTHI